MMTLIIVVLVANLGLTIACIGIAKSTALLRQAQKEMDLHADIDHHVAAGGAVGDRDWCADAVAGD